MTTADRTTTVDSIAMALGGGLIFLGLVVLGVLEAIIGNPHAVPQTNDAGKVVATTTFDPTLRAAIIALGMLIWLLYGLYKVVGGRVERATDKRTVVTD
ncbi:MAG: hypothetical protein SVG88_11835 [Halobacteriales archaeon]|nr:hypothetical protein [Halobacteriales archaeon]